MALKKNLAVRMLAISAIASIIALLMPTQITAEDINIDVTAEISGWILTPDVYSQPNTNESCTLHVIVDNVTESKTWQVTVSDLDATNTNGHLTSYNGSSYDTDTQISNPLQVQQDTTTLTLPGGGVIVSGSGIYDHTYDIVLKQEVSWNDPVADNYRIVITFSASFTN